MMSSGTEWATVSAGRNALQGKARERLPQQVAAALEFRELAAA